MSALRSCNLFILTHIPSAIHAYHLRSLFSFYVEQNIFSMFHYMHRKMKPLKLPSAPTSTTDKDCHPRFALFLVRSDCRDLSFMKFFNRRLFTTSDCQLKLPKEAKCLSVDLFEVMRGESDIALLFMRILNKKGIRPGEYDSAEKLFHTITSHFEEFTPCLEEMPNGNVGTTNCVFNRLISQCRLSSEVIKRLHLNAKCYERKYCAIPFSYDDDINQTNDRDSVCDGEEENEESDLEEDWERRCSGRLEKDGGADIDEVRQRKFEEPAELVWEKGGSGLVFYTDDWAWKYGQGGDVDSDGGGRAFDEQCVDDLDVDVAVYDDADDGDMDARQRLEMMISDRLWQGKSADIWSSDSSDENDRPSALVPHRKRRSRLKRVEKDEQQQAMFLSDDYVGYRLIQKQGWQRGQELGKQNKSYKNQFDLSEKGGGPLDGVQLAGQSHRLVVSHSQKREPKRRKTRREILRPGLGYKGEKLIP